jgi:DNA-binding LacI/PurR family transcriptional regulator
MASRPNRESRSSGRPTLGQVAARAGVGQGTASRAINGSAHITDSTRLAVLRAAEELGYVPNRAARALVTRRTDSVALVVSEPEERIFNQPFFARIVRGISQEVTASGRQLLLTMVPTTENRQRLVHYLAGQHVDGALVLSLHGDDPLPRLLEEQGVPVVVGGRPLTWQPPTYVEVDNLGGSVAAVTHLMERGRVRIATIAGTQDMNAGVQRLAGYRQAFGSTDERLVAYGDHTSESGEAATRELLRRVPDLDAIFAASDPMALAALRTLRSLGRRVPEDVAVVGFDDTPSSQESEPALTTVHQPIEEMGRTMAELLATRIDGADAPGAVVLPTQLVVRDSS